MYFESTKFCNIIDAISTIVSLQGCKVKEPKIPEKTKATTFPQNIKCTVPGVFCATIRYYCLLICILNLLYYSCSHVMIIYKHIIILYYSCPPFDLPKTDTAIKLQIETEFISSVVKNFVLVENTVGKFRMKARFTIVIER